MTATPHSPEVQFAAARVEGWLDTFAAFCRTRGGACYAGWSPEVLRDYLAFHIRQDTFRFVRTGGQIVGCAVAWQCRLADLRAAAAAHRTFFAWQPDDPQGDALFIADVIATQHPALLALAREFPRRFPRWRELPIYTFRPQPDGRPVLKRYPVRLFHHLFRSQRKEITDR